MKRFFKFIIFLAILVLPLSVWASGTPFTSTGSGDWNAGATWGNGGSTKGTDWPGTAGDVVNIGTTANQAHIVTYNVSEANELGDVTIGATSGTGTSELIFAVNANTLLTIGAGKYVKVNAKGKYTQGASGAVIGAGYTSELRANPASDSSCGLKFNGAGAQINIYGDPTYYGSVTHAFLTNISTDSQTFIVGGDVSTWAPNGIIYVHKGTTFAAYNTDINGSSNTPFTVATATYDGGTDKTTIVINEAAPTGTFAVGGRVVNVARNVKIAKSSASTNIDNRNTNRVHFDGGSFTIGTLNIFDTLCTGVYGISSFSMPFVITNSAFRNGQNMIYMSFCGTVTNVIGACLDSVLRNFGYCTVTLNAAFAIFGNPLNTPITNNTISGNIYSARGSTGPLYADIGLNLNYFSNGGGLLGGGSYKNCKFGYNENDIAMANAYDLESNWFDTFLSYCKIVDISGYTNIKLRNSAVGIMAKGYFYIEHFNQTINDSRIIGLYGSSKRIVADGSSTNPSQRSGGSVDSLRFSAESLCNSILYFSAPPTRVWFITGTAKTYRFYVQTDYATGSPVLPTAGFKLYANYIAATGLITAATPSTQDIATRANQADWSQYVEVTIPSTAQTGWVDLYFKLMEYESGKFVWIDPKVEVQ